MKIGADFYFLTSFRIPLIPSFHIGLEITLNSKYSVFQIKSLFSALLKVNYILPGPYVILVSRSAPAKGVDGKGLYRLRK